MSEPIVVVQRIAAPPAVVYEYLTDAEKWGRWQGTGASLEARPGGDVVLAMPNGETARGRFMGLVPGRRVSFTWGWNGHPAVPPGSTAVEIDLVPDGDGTLVRLTHSGLPADEVPLHRAGWEHYLPRLALAAAGEDPGTDPGPRTRSG